MHRTYFGYQKKKIKFFSSEKKKWKKNLKIITCSVTSVFICKCTPDLCHLTSNGLLSRLIELANWFRKK